jgi:hypothetical protein
MEIGLLTIEQKEEIQGKEYAPDSYFNSVQDEEENWVISIEEMDQCVNDEFIWVKDLPLIEYKPKQNIIE